jgi:diadenosine tetraphosphatase ApaH/serine/threonine PP2A family protein phosphatase
VYLVNPGSVGEPRDGDWRASFVLYDSDAGEITFHRVRYNAAATLWRTRVSGIPVPRRRLLAESIRVLIPKGT